MRISSPPRPVSGRGEQNQKDVGNDEASASGSVCSNQLGKRRSLGPFVPSGSNVEREIERPGQWSQSIFDYRLLLSKVS